MLPPRGNDWGFAGKQRTLRPSPGTENGSAVTAQCMYEEELLVRRSATAKGMDIDQANSTNRSSVFKKLPAVSGTALANQRHIINPPLSPLLAIAKRRSDVEYRLTQPMSMPSAKQKSHPFAAVRLIYEMQKQKVSSGRRNPLRSLLREKGQGCAENGHCGKASKLDPSSAGMCYSLHASVK